MAFKEWSRVEEERLLCLTDDRLPAKVIAAVLDRSEQEVRRKRVSLIAFGGDNMREA
ncbi:hypothetical protein [Sphingomicrobium arenosum]|uniref:hypothetical protein n=1 Tax=Sphingomicrobium arenosum TaxID=2233861 RepID=UPI00223FB7E4|nr:hypothetical protein [Sphingomicrobium arenosum]